MPDDLKNALNEFVRFAQTLRGDDEFRVAKKPGSPQLELIKGDGAKPKGGKKFADLLWLAPRAVRVQPQAI